MRYTGATGDFTASFINRVGTRIEITNASVTDKLDESIVWSNPTINGVDPCSTPQIIASGDSLRLDANNNGAGIPRNDPFDLITITYDQMGDGIKTTHIETGRVRSSVE